VPLYLQIQLHVGEFRYSLLRLSVDGTIFAVLTPCRCVTEVFRLCLTHVGSKGRMCISETKTKGRSPIKNHLTHKPTTEASNSFCEPPSQIQHRHFLGLASRTANKQYSGKNPDSKFSNRRRVAALLYISFHWQHQAQSDLQWTTCC
jgi:hypothetical protein